MAESSKSRNPLPLLSNSDADLIPPIGSGQGEGGSGPQPLPELGLAGLQPLPDASTENESVTPDVQLEQDQGPLGQRQQRPQQSLIDTPDAALAGRLPGESPERHAPPPEEGDDDAEAAGPDSDETVGAIASLASAIDEGTEKITGFIERFETAAYGLGTNMVTLNETAGALIAEIQALELGND